MAGILSMAAALKGFEKTGKVSRLTDDGAYRLTIVRIMPDQATTSLPPSTTTTTTNETKKQYLLEVMRTPRKDNPKSSQVDTPELTMRFDSLEKVLGVANQALKGGLETLMLFYHPHS